MATATNKSRTNKPAKHPLKDQFFLTYGDKDGKPVSHWQGVVLDVLKDDILFVQLYEWIAGYPSTRHLIPISDTLTKSGSKARWDFFSNRDDWLEHAKRPAV